MIPAVKAYVRPDGRHFVGDPDPESLAEATTDVYCTVEASEIDSYLALGSTSIVEKACTWYRSDSRAWKHRTASCSPTPMRSTKQPCASLTTSYAGRPRHERLAVG